MSGKIEAARAFLKAGNAKLALQHAEDALKENQTDNNATDVYFDILFELGQLAQAEEVAGEWLGRSPSDARAHSAMIACSFKRGDKKKSRKLIDDFRLACPYRPKDIENIEALFKIKFGNQVEGFASLAKSSSAAGDKKSEFKFSSYAALKRANLSEAIIEAEFARRSGDESSQNLAYLAMLYYRTFRFGKCRKYARLALKAEPGMPVPRELLILSWLVLFPPFLMAHFGLMLMAKLTASTAGLIVFVLLLAFGAPAVFVLFSIVSNLMSPLGLDGWPTFAMVFAFAFYSPYIGTIGRLLKGRRPQEIRLSDY